MNRSADNPYTLELTQFTPLLHFDRAFEATLRATELKPKIDHYILANYEVQDSWLIPLKKEERKDAKHRALQYKLSIVAGKNRQLQNTKYPMYFGKDKVGVKADTVTLYFFSYNNGLLDCLRGLDWNNFFLANNFGTRQDKGYGSFFPVPADNKGPSVLVGLTSKCGQWIKIGGLANQYRLDSFIVIPDSEKNDWYSVMKRINDIARCLRSGINGPKENDFYFKSLMFSYAKEKGLFWDKRIIKSHFYSRELKLQQNSWKEKAAKSFYDNSPLGWEAKKKDEYDFRDYLGLSSFENWGHSFGRLQKKAGPIKRWKSPLLFKPIFDTIDKKWYIFLLHREIPEDLKGKKIFVKTSEQSFEVPLYTDFSMQDYLSFVFNKDAGIIDYASQCNNAKHPDAGIILKDLEALRKNYKKIDIQ